MHAKYFDIYSQFCNSRLWCITIQANLHRFQAIAKMNDICKKANVPMAKAALSWVLNQPNVPVAIVGARTPEQMVENCEIVDLPQVFCCWMNKLLRYSDIPHVPWTNLYLWFTGDKLVRAACFIHTGFDITPIWQRQVRSKIICSEEVLTNISWLQIKVGLLQ